MIANKSVIAIIPARGGSKGLPGKNIKDLCGKPLIVWTIEAALKSSYIDTVLVTSDDDNILKISEAAGAKIIKRPSNLATDESPSMDAILHALEHRKKYDIVILLQPTSPLRNNQHIDEALELFISKESNSVISVSEVIESPYWMYEIKEGVLRPLLENTNVTRRQDLPKVYKLNGALYIKQYEKLVLDKSFVDLSTYSYVMPLNIAIDIDNKLDWQLATKLLEEGNKCISNK